LQTCANSAACAGIDSARLGRDDSAWFDMAPPEGERSTDLIGSTGVRY
jgi:hypothetical protein